MEIVWNSYKNEQCYSNHRSDGDFFEQGTELMTAFGGSHHFLEYTKHTGAFRLVHTNTEPVAAGARRSLLRLLNLIPVYGIVVLPRNTQN